MIYEYSDIAPDTPGEGSEDCPHCESDRKRHEGFCSQMGKEYYICLDCNEIYYL